MCGVFCAFVAAPALAQEASPEYDLESLGEELVEEDAAALCAEFTLELQKLAGCNEAIPLTGDPSLAGVDQQELDGVRSDGSSPFGGVDPTQDVMNGLPGGGGGDIDAFGGALDDLTGGLFPGDL